MLKSRHCSLWMCEVPDSYVHSSQEGSLFWTSQQGCLCLTSHVVLSTFLHLLTCPCHNFLSQRSGFYALENYFLTIAHVYYTPIGSVMLNARSKIISQRYIFQDTVVRKCLSAFHLASSYEPLLPHCSTGLVTHIMSSRSHAGLPCFISNLQIFWKIAEDSEILW